MPGKRLNSQARQMVANLITYFTSEKENGGPLISLNSIQQRVADALKVSLRSISSIKVKNDINKPLSTPGKSRPRAKPKTINMDEPIKMEVRNVIYDMCAQKKHFTIRSLQNELLLKEIIHISYGSLRALLLHLGFKYIKEDNQKVLVEKPNIAMKRAQFFRGYMENLNSPYRKQLVFLGETWIFSKGSKKGMQDSSKKCVLKPDGIEEKRFIALHAGHRGGFVENASLIFSTKSKLADYHGDMNAKLFTIWVQNQLIPNLKESSLIVMDNAPYHSVEVEKQPCSSWKKGDIANWLSKNNISFDSTMLKSELLSLTKLHRKPVEYQIDNMLRENGHDVLRVPPYHCEFNAIELIWTDAKAYYNKHIGEGGTDDEAVLNLWKDALERSTPEVWTAKVNHTEKLIQEWYKREHIIDDMPQLMINVSQDGSDSSDTDSDIS